MPCQTTPSRPRAAHVVGRPSASVRTQPGSRNAGSHRPPSSESVRMTRIDTLRARVSLPPSEATTRPVAAESSAALSAIRTKPGHEPLTRTPKKIAPTPNVTMICASAMRAVASALPARRTEKSIGAQRRRSQMPRRRSRRNSRPESRPRKRRYCSVMPQKLWLKAWTARAPPADSVWRSTSNGRRSSPPPSGARNSRASSPMTISVRTPSTHRPSISLLGGWRKPTRAFDLLPVRSAIDTLPSSAGKITTTPDDSSASQRRAAAASDRRASSCGLAHSAAPMRARRGESSSTTMRTRGRMSSVPPGRWNTAPKTLARTIGTAKQSSTPRRSAANRRRSLRARSQTRRSAFMRRRSLPPAPPASGRGRRAPGESPGRAPRPSASASPAARRTVRSATPTRPASRRP